MIRSISVLTGGVQDIANDGSDAEVSPDGQQIVYVDGQNKEIKLAGSHGESPRTFFRAPDGELVGSAHWLPGGKRIGYLRAKAGAAEAEIETRDLRGGDVRSVLESTANSIAFAPDGHVFYTTTETSPQQLASLWSVALDPTTWARAGQPVKLSTWPGVVAAEPLTISADGRRLVLTKQFAQSDVYLLGLDADGSATAAPRQLTTDTQVDWPSQWSRDGSSFLFFSNRTGALRAFRQPIAAETPEPIVTGAGHVRSPQVTADGKWIVYLEMTAGPDAARIMRVPVAGGPAEQVLAVSSHLETATMRFFAPGPGTSGIGAHAFPDLRCPAQWDGSCVLAEVRADKTQQKTHVVLSTFDPATGRMRELAVLPGESADLTFWDVTPDGSAIAFGEFAWGGGDRFTLLHPATGETRVVRLQHFKNVSDLAWAADGRSLFATTTTIRGAEVIHVMLDGTTHLVRAFQSLTVQNPRPSADGRSLLVGILSTSSNAWVIEP